MKEYILPILIFLGFGALSGILLLIASKVLAVKTDETEAKITEALPGANCGGCGYSGCAGYAAAVAHDGAPTNLCKPGGADVMKKINAIMGTEGGEFIREVAYVRCNGCEKATKDRFTFTGTKSCAAVEKFYNGKGECRFGCDGYGDCAAVCGNDAITITDGVAVVDPAKCGGGGGGGGRASLRWSTLLSAAVAESALPPVRITLYSLEKKQAQLLCVARQRTAARSQERYVQTAVSAVRYARKNVLTVRLSLRITTLLSTMTNVPRAAPAYLPVRESALSI